MTNDWEKLECDDSVQEVTIPTPEDWKCHKPNCPTEFLHNHTTYESLKPVAEEKEWIEKIEEVVNTIREQNWKNGGGHVWDTPEAVIMVTTLIRELLASHRSTYEGELEDTLRCWDITRTQGGSASLACDQGDINVDLLHRLDSLRDKVEGKFVEELLEKMEKKRKFFINPRTGKPLELTWQGMKIRPDKMDYNDALDDIISLIKESLSKTGY